MSDHESGVSVTLLEMTTAESQGVREYRPLSDFVREKVVEKMEQHPVMCMDCGKHTGTWSLVTDSTGICDPCLTWRYPA